MWMWVGGCHICRLGSFGSREGTGQILGKDPEDVIDRPRDTLGAPALDMYLQIDHTPIHTSDERGRDFAVWGMWIFPLS